MNRDGVSRCALDELGELHEFRRRLWGTESRVVDPARTSWLCVHNPALNEGEDPSIWIWRDAGTIVGAVAEIPYRLKIGDDECRSQWGINLAVDPGWRGRGIAGQLSATIRAECRVTCGADYSVGGRKHAVRNDYVFLGTVPVYGLVIEPRALVEAIAASRPWLRVSIPVLSVAARVVARVAASLARIRSRGFELVPIDAFDARVDEIWDAVSPHYTVIGRRDAVWLRWRFDESPEASDYLRFYLLDRQRPAGYAVFRTSSWGDGRALKLVDYLAAPDHAGPLFACAGRVARDHGASTLGCTTLNHRARAALRSLGFLHSRKLSRVHGLVVHTGNDDPARPLLVDAKNWFITDADSDLD